MDPSRRAFIRFTVTLVGAAGLGACGTNAPPPGGYGGGGSTGGGGGEGSCSTNGAIATAISANHGHSLRVPATDFTDGADKTYDILGSSTHSHFVTLSLAQRNTLLAGTPVTVVSTSAEQHTHAVTISCA